MKIDEVFSESYYKLKNVYFENHYLDEKESLVTFRLKDSLDNYQLKDNILYANFTRKLAPEGNNSIIITVTYDFRARIKEGCGIAKDIDAIIEVAESDKTQLLARAISEATWTIANLTKSAGFDVIITAPVFVD